MDRHVVPGEAGRQRTVFYLCPGGGVRVPGTGSAVRKLDQPCGGDLVVPLAALGVVIALFVRHADNNVYTQIGVVLLVALASKNAILIVEFGNQLRKEGRTIRDGAIDAARLRFRAILMTAFSSILGFLPLLVSSGAGAASRQAVGNAVVGGMIAATFFSLLFVPTFFVVFRTLSERATRKPNSNRVA